MSFNYEPGSTFKVVAVSGGLESGLITPSTPFAIPDEIQVANRTIHDAEEHGEETLTTAEILAQSSNVGAIKIGALDGPERFNQWVHKYGFGARTGVELPGEETGVTLPPSEYSGSSMGNLPIGQGELVTPMQMVSAYSAIANGGILRRPHIIGAVDGRPQPEPAGRRVISAKTSAEIRTMLKGVLAPGGTASEVSIPGYELAGKTGTASKVDPATGEYSETAYVASFIGFAPAQGPEAACARSSSTNPRTARSTAAPSPPPPSVRSCPSRCRTCASRRGSPPTLRPRRSPPVAVGLACAAPAATPIPTPRARGVPSRA